MSLTLESRRAVLADVASAAMPLTFVFLWSTGFIGAKLGLPHAGPFTFLSLRYLLAAALLLPFAILWHAPWPRSWADAGHIAVTGLLVNCGCLGACFYALSLGLPTAVVALIGGLQPILTGVFAGALLRERVSTWQWLGLGLGFAGVLLVLSDRLSLGSAPPIAIAAAFMGLLAITAATLYQKRFCANVPLRSGALIQLTLSAAVMLPIAAMTEGVAVNWNGEFVFALVWLAVVLSLGALTLLWALVRKGAAAKVSSLFYLTPPTTAVMGWLVFDERFGALALLGMAVVVAGVALAARDTAQPAAVKTTPS